MDGMSVAYRVLPQQQHMNKLSEFYFSRDDVTIMQSLHLGLLGKGLPLKAPSSSVLP